MKILSQTGNYISGTKIVQNDNGTIQKLKTYLDNTRKPCESVQNTWDNFEAYIEDTKQKSIDMNKVFKNW